MLAVQTCDGHLQVWRVPKLYNIGDSAYLIRHLGLSKDPVGGPNWMGWSKSGRIIQYSNSYVQYLTHALSCIILQSLIFTLAKRYHGMSEQSMLPMSLFLLWNISEVSLSTALVPPYLRWDPTIPYSSSISTLRPSWYLIRSTQPTCYHLPMCPRRLAISHSTRM